VQAFRPTGSSEANKEKHQPIPSDTGTAFQGRGADGGVIEPFLESVGQGSDLVREEVRDLFDHLRLNGGREIMTGDKVVHGVTSSLHGYLNVCV